RTTRQMQLTHIGATYFERSRRIFEDLAALEGEMEKRDEIPRGLLRVTAPVVLGHVRVLPAVLAFRRAYPNVRIDVLLFDRLVDLVEERVDVAVRMTASPPLSYVAKKLGDDERKLCASPDYLAQHRRPTRPKDLEKHDCLVFDTGGVPAPWKLRSDAGKPMNFRVCGPLQMNNTLSLHQAALAGLGIADLPTYLVADDLRAGRLKSVLDDYVTVGRAVYAVYTPGRSVPASVREFVKFLVHWFAKPEEHKAAS
ncbi:MAG TPA: substrate binding domain-containing protein, partial [Polyangiaceae bacterium]|nr:substrate binding domain-containing protein [Polyangiaceae bacterium]